MVRGLPRSGLVRTGQRRRHQTAGTPGAGTRRGRAALGALHDGDAVGPRPQPRTGRGVGEAVAHLLRATALRNLRSLKADLSAVLHRWRSLRPVHAASSRALIIPGSD